MNVLAIYCKTCGALFYANAHVLPEDVPDILAYARAGHHVALVDHATVRRCLAACHCADPAPTGAQLITAERERQVQLEGFTAEHDDAHIPGDLARAGAAYILLPIAPREFVCNLWPWRQSEFKPSDDDPLRNLVRAGALIAAEIDRLLRAGQQEAAHD